MTALGLGLLFGAAPAIGADFEVEDVSPPRIPENPPQGEPSGNPCGDDGALSEDDYNALKDLIEQVLSDEAGVIADIDAQVGAESVLDGPVEVEIDVVGKDEFISDYADDRDRLPGAPSRDELEEEAERNWNAHVGYAYPDDGENLTVNQKVRIKLFCKDALRHMIKAKDSARKLIIHELVHAKVSAIEILGPKNGTLPFDHHNKDGVDGKPFFDEIDRLEQLLKKNLELAYNPGGQFSGPVRALGLVSDGESELIPTELEGSGTVVQRSTDDADSDGKADIPIELIELDLQSSDPPTPPVELDEDPDLPSEGQVEEQTSGVAFPADSAIGVWYRFSVDGAPGGPVLASLGAQVDQWPPYGIPFVVGSSAPITSQAVAPSSPVVQLQSLVFLAVDTDNDGVPDFRDIDDDGDGVVDEVDPAPQNADRDADGVADGADNCPDTPNPDQTDRTGGGVGDACQTTDRAATAIPTLSLAGGLVLAILMFGLVARTRFRRRL